MACFADVFPIIVGDSPPAHVRRMCRAAEARFFPRRNFRPSGSPGALENQPGLWEVVSETELPPYVWDRLGDPDSLVRHCLNGRRVERLLRGLRNLRPDLVVLCDGSMALLAAHVRALGVKVVAAPHNFDSALYAAMADGAPGEYVRRWNEAAGRAFQAAEKIYTPHIDQLWVCSAEDASRFAALPAAPEQIRIIPNVYDVAPPSRLPAHSHDLVFVGQGNYFPNEDAIFRLFAISRTLDSRGVAHRMRIVGRIGAAARAAAADCPSVDIVGEVASVAPYIEGAAMAPIPLTLGGGTRLKIIEAMAAGRPVLSTPIGIEGLAAENLVHALIEPDISAFPDRIEQLLRDRALAQRLADNGWALAQEKYSHTALLRCVGAALRDLGLGDGEPSTPSLARNIGARVTQESLQFNKMNRLLTWTLLVRLAAPPDRATAHIEIGGEADAATIFATVRDCGRGLAAVEANGFLPLDCPLESITLHLRAWGQTVLRHAPHAPIVQESAGLVSLEPTGEGLDVIGWTTRPAATLVPAPLVPPTTAPASLPGIDLVRAQYAKLDGAVSLENEGGVGQSLPNPDFWLRPDKASSARLGRLRNCHEGETAWLIGNGPSVRPADLDRLAGRLTFCFNRFHLAHGTTKLRAAYTLTGDKQMIDDFGQQIVDESGGTVFIAHEHAPDLLGDYIWLRQISIFPPLFSLNPDRAVSPGGSTPYVAMQLAYYMGVRKFYFYGADLNFRFARSGVVGDPFRIASGEGNHFIPNYRDDRPWCPPSLFNIGAGFLAARLLLETEGGFIRNVTHGGRLEIFERADFDAALAG